jgi:hypothetical protein
VANRIVAPLTGNVSNGSWVAVDINVPGVSLPSGKPVHFCYLLPDQYNANNLYPIMIWLHPDFEGTNWYQGNDTPTGLAGADADGFYNNTNFRTNYPSICIVGFADQTSGNDAIDNWGGWVNDGSVGSGTHASGDTGPNVFGMIGVVQWVIANLSGDPNRVYVEGFSLGGIGAEYMMLMYNQVNGAQKIFTSGTSTGGVCEIHGYGQGPNATDLAHMQGVPVWWVSGAQDGTSVPADWNLPTWRALSGNSSYPAPNSSPAASQAGSSNLHFWLDPNIGHQQTDANGNPYPVNTEILNFMYSQIGGVAVTPTIPTPTSPTRPTTPTPPSGIITRTSGGSVVDAAGNTWTLDTAGNLIENGTGVPAGAGTSGLTVVSGVIWAQDANTGTWYTYVGGQFVAQPGSPPNNPTTPTVPTVPTTPSPTITNAITWNPADKSPSIVLSNNNLTALSVGGDTSNRLQQSVRSTVGYSSGLYYFEFTVNVWTNDTALGIATLAYNLAPVDGLGGDPTGAAFRGATVINPQGIFVGDPFHGTFGSGIDANGDVICVAVNINTTEIWFASPVMRAQGLAWNNSASANPATGVGGTNFAVIGNGPYFVTYNDDFDGSRVTVNFGGSIFTQPMPAGFARWQPSIPTVPTVPTPPPPTPTVPTVVPTPTLPTPTRPTPTLPTIPTPTRPTTPTPSQPTPTLPTPTVPTPTVPSPTTPTPTTPTPSQPTIPTPTRPTTPTPTQPTPTLPTPTLPTPTRPTAPTPTVPTPVAPTPTTPTPVGTSFITYPLATTATNLVISGLQALTMYDFEIVATNNLGSSVSPIISATTGAASIPTIPTPTVPTIPTPTIPTPTVPTPLIVSASGTQVTGTIGRIVDSGFNIWTITSTQLASVNGNVLASPSAVALLYYWQNIVYLKNSAGNWFAWNGVSAFAASASPLSPTPTSPTIPTPTIPTPTRPTPTIPTPTIPTPTVPTVPTPPSLTIITTTSGGQVSDSSGNIWTLDSNGNLLENGTGVAGGSGTTKLTVVNGLIWAQDVNTGTWYTYVGGQFVSQGTSTPGPTSPTSPTPTRPTTPSTPTAPGSSFRVQNGQIIDPNGNIFVARGINCGPQDMGQPILATFPGINFIRLATWYTAPYSNANYQAFVATMSAAGVVVEIEDHAYPSPLPYSGQQLNDESNWYAGLAALFVNNPYVWFGTMNEPGDGGDYGGTGPGISAQHLATYQAIRNAGNNTILMMDYFGGGNPGAIGAGYGVTVSTYANMTNVVWDYHFYGWIVGTGDTNQNDINAALLGSSGGGSGILACQSVQSADGLVPVIVGEFGNSTTGSSVDPNGPQVVSAVLGSGYGFAAWTWGGAGGADQLTQNGSLTAFGQQVVAGIAASKNLHGSKNVHAITIAPSQGLGITQLVTTWAKAIISTLSNNDFTATSGGLSDPGITPQTVRSTTSMSAGKLYFEITMVTATKNFAIGIINALFDGAASAGLGSDANGMGYYPLSPIQAIYVNNNEMTSGTQADANGAILSIAIDLDLRRFWASSPAMRAAGYAWNNSLSDNPALAAGGIDMAQLGPGPYFIAYNNREGGGVAILNAGGSRFDQPVPSGFTAWATALPSIVLPPTPLAALESINWCSAMTLPAMRWAGNSPHTSVYYDTLSYSDTEGQSIGSQFLANVENYYQTLVNWFNGYEPLNSNGLATRENPFGRLINYFIVSNGSFQAGHCSCINADILVDFSSVDRLNMDAIFCEFLLELSEVFMPCLSALPDCDTYSVGEGMSNAMAIELHGGGIGTTVANVAIRWLDQTVAGIQRADFVNNNVIYNTTAPTAVTRLVGPGCCCVFFFYLRFQLLYSWPQITAALNTLPPQANLRQVYLALTGNPIDPFPAFLALLNSVYAPSVPLGEAFNPLRLFPITP